MPEAPAPDAPAEAAPAEPTPASAEEHPPQNIPEAALRAAVGMLDYRVDDPEHPGHQVPAIPQPADRESWIMGAKAGIEGLLRLVPAPDPTAIALEQLWLYMRAVGSQINVLTGHTSRIVGKLDEYEDLLPAPDSLMARAGRWGSRRTMSNGPRG